MDVFEQILCKDVVKLEPQYIDKNYKTHVLTKLKKKVEGVCSKHGYIKNDSIKIDIDCNAPKNSSSSERPTNIT